jgi:D-beta-D-heptose 7-phosphate kinase/D-beta-D-heptose 1-phosphate adenosyltransferase
MAAGAKVADAAKIANYAAGIVVGVVGTATVSPAQLKQWIAEQRGTRR